MSLTAILLTHNESLHIVRAIESIRDFASRVVVVDSFSTDNTRELAESLGAHVYTRKFKNYADQFSWAMNECSIDSDWILRLDADEVIHADLSANIVKFLANPPPDVGGVNLQRRHVWMGRWIRFGGRYPLNLVRIWRRGCAHIESRWMDEHMVVDQGRTITLRGGFSDWNLNDITFFTEKHNKYATREAIDVLGAKYNLFLGDISLSKAGTSFQAAIKRSVKTHVYNQLPFWLSAYAYFVWRYVFQLGFLDGLPGLIYHTLQGYWYRFLVGAKIAEYERVLKLQPDRLGKIAALEQLTGHKLL